jgi:hypothetical protein
VQRFLAIYERDFFMKNITAKKEFFDKFHQSIVDKYPNLYDKSLVEKLRRYAITYDNSLSQIIILLDEKNAFTWREAKRKQRVINSMQNTIANIPKRERLTREVVCCIDNMNRRKMLMNFLKTCTEDQWNDITKRTQYDKQQ